LASLVLKLGSGIALLAIVRMVMMCSVDLYLLEYRQVLFLM